MSNPSDDDYLEDLMAGERTTWPHISRIRLHVAIELILDDCRQSCRRSAVAAGALGLTAWSHHPPGNWRGWRKGF
jgi:hypothetical protein